MDSLALGAFGVIAAQGALRRGLHPAVACAAGVSICFGGILRDLLCGRSVALCSQSFALATLAGASAYVSATKLAVLLGGARGAPLLPLGGRIAIGVGTTMAVRALAWSKKPEDLLGPMANFAG